MDKEQVWKQFVKKYPKFETSGAHFTPAGLKKFFDTTWDAAQSQTVPGAKFKLPSLTEVLDLFKKK
ncbi:MAG: hypothetical protein M0R32_10430 [Candidatus Cloacimonetes bacterium]|jgi:hypothetical protein|nr:hypothetical protein [Candidatus Cloacimonadota bacterium]